jgi:hypothetical protein
MEILKEITEKIRFIQINIDDSKKSYITQFI